jgi:hypothetical protein
MKKGLITKNKIIFGVFAHGIFKMITWMTFLFYLQETFQNLLCL